MPIKLIAMDLDGTLLNTESRVPEENIRAIQEAVKRGIEVVVVTGRRYHSARLIVDALPEKLHLIVNNGALIKTKEGETHQRMLLPAAVARRVLRATPEFRSSAAVVFDRPKENQVIMEHIDWDDPFRGGYFRRSREFLAEVKPLERCLPDGQAAVASDEWRVARENQPATEARLGGQAQSHGERLEGRNQKAETKSEKQEEKREKQIPHTGLDQGRDRVRDDSVTHETRKGETAGETPALQRKAMERNGHEGSSQIQSGGERGAASSAPTTPRGETAGETPALQNHDDPIQVMFVGLCATIRSVLERLEGLPFRDEFTIAFTEYLTRDISVLDVLGKGVSKGVALAEWARHQGIRREEVMAIGDNWNDREMLEFAGLPVVMGNSVEGLKSKGWAVTLSNDEAGLAHAIRRWALKSSGE